MYMGEIGHNTRSGWKHFAKSWKTTTSDILSGPIKKWGLCFVSIGTPENWDQIVAFSEAPRDTYAVIREARPDQQLSRLAMMQF